MFNKLNSSVSGIFVFLFTINIVSRVLGFFREILFANFFGTQKEFDVYLIASVIPTSNWNYYSIHRTKLFYTSI